MCSSPFFTLNINNISEVFLYFLKYRSSQNYKTLGQCSWEMVCFTERNPTSHLFLLSRTVRRGCEQASSPPLHRFISTARHAPQSKAYGKMPLPLLPAGRSHSTGSCRSCLCSRRGLQAWAHPLRGPLQKYQGNIC